MSEPVEIETHAAPAPIESCRRMIKQISAAASGRFGEVTVFALCADGTLWVCLNADRPSPKWQRLPSIPVEG